MSVVGEDGSWRELRCFGGVPLSRKGLLSSVFFGMCVSSVNVVKVRLCRFIGGGGDCDATRVVLLWGATGFATSGFVVLLFLGLRLLLCASSRGASFCSFPTVSVYG